MTQSLSAIEIRRVGPDLFEPLEKFFLALQAAGYEGFFHPHPFDSAQARRLADYSGSDLYYVVVETGRVLAYGMLRGWDEGYEIPSLGIAVHPDLQGQGLGRTLMHFLHSAARSRGAAKVRLKVDPSNLTAIALYHRLGYVFEQSPSGEFVGSLAL